MILKALDQRNQWLDNQIHLNYRTIKHQKVPN